jgi:hypothetical protein
MKQTLKRIIRNVKSINGNSLAEFATTTALMATLAATAAPKLSEMSEGTMAEKSKNEMDKILTQARNHYQTTSNEEGRGRFPGQDKYNLAVGSYSNEDDVITDLANWTTYDNAIGAKWCSVFGITNAAAPKHTDCKVVNDVITTHSGNGGAQLGHVEWLALFAENTLTSKYQDGHFAYAVVPGGGQGKSAYPPVMYVVDVENASDFNNVIEP